MEFNKYQIEAIKKIQEILKLEYIDPNRIQKEVEQLQKSLKNITTVYSKDFSNIKNSLDSQKFILLYLSKSISKDSFNKIKSNYEKTKKISLDLIDKINSNQEKDSMKSTLENLLSGFSDALNSNNKSNAKGILEAIKETNPKDLENNLKGTAEQDPQKVMDMLGSLLDGIGIKDSDGLEALMSLGQQCQGKSEEELDKLAEEMANKIEKSNPELYKKLTSEDDEEYSEDYMKGFKAGQNRILDNFNLPTVDKLNQASAEWKKQKADPKIQAQLKAGKPVKPNKPFMKQYNGVCVLTSEIKANKIAVKDPKKCFLLFVDEEGKVHQISQTCLEKGEYSIDPKKGISKKQSSKIK